MLSSIIDRRNFHTEIRNDKELTFMVHSRIPKCFKLDLQSFKAPVMITIDYKPDLE